MEDTTAAVKVTVLPETEMEKVSVNGEVVALSTYDDVIPLGVTVNLENPNAVSFLAAK